MRQGYTTHNSIAARPNHRSEEDRLYWEALGILHRLATENTGWRSIFRRWYYSDEPLRHDAANLIRQARYEIPRPEHTRLVGESFNTHPID